MIDWNTTIGVAASTVAVMGGVYSAIRHFYLSQKVKKEMYKEEILRMAKEEANKIKEELEVKIKDLEEELKNQKEDVSKDIGHLKQTFNSDIKSLGEKIELLRTDLAFQHGALLNLLTKLVDIK